MDRGCARAALVLGGAIALVTACTDLQDGDDSAERTDAAVLAEDSGSADAGEKPDAALKRPIDASVVTPADAATDEHDAATEATDAVFELGMPCDRNGELGCAGHDQALTLFCAQGVWTREEVCEASKRCDSRLGPTQGQCLDIIAECASAEPGTEFCEGDQRMACGPDRVTAVARPCSTGEICVTVATTVACSAEGPSCSVEAPCSEESNPCLTDNGGCDTDPGAACTPQRDGSTTCECPADFEGDGRGENGCTAIDHCAGGAEAVCGAGATACDSAAEDHVCTCGTGFEGTGTTSCTDVDECADGAVAACGAGATACRNVGGGYVCTCDGSHTGTGSTHCDDIDACAAGVTAVCGPGATGCTSVASLPHCTCGPGYWAAASGSCRVSVNEGFDDPLTPALWSSSFTAGAADVHVDTASGELRMQTIPNPGCATAEVHGLAQGSVAGGNVLVFDSRVLDAYVDQGIYGNAQPRGLAAGTDRNNAIEFINAQPVPHSVTCRTVSSGVATETTVDIGQSVRSPARYKIIARADHVEFYVNGTLVATHTDHIPQVPLNVYFGTGDGCAGDVPLVVDSVSFESLLPDECAVSSANPFRENFSVDPLDPQWDQFTYTGMRHNSQSTPANHISLGENPGVLRYDLDPMTLIAAAVDYAPAQPYYWYDPGTEISRELGGDYWTLESKVDWYVPNVVNSAELQQAVHFGAKGSAGLHCSLTRFSNDDVGAGSSHTNNILAASCTIGANTLGSSWSDWAGLDTHIVRYVQFVRTADLLSIRLSTDDVSWSEVTSVQIPEQFRCADQRFSISGAAWFNPNGSYADYDLVRFDRRH